MSGERPSIPENEGRFVRFERRIHAFREVLDSIDALPPVDKRAQFSDAQIADERQNLTSAFETAKNSFPANLQSQFDRYLFLREKDRLNPEFSTLSKNTDVMLLTTLHDGVENIINRRAELARIINEVTQAGQVHKPDPNQFLAYLPEKDRAFFEKHALDIRYETASMLITVTPEAFDRFNKSRPTVVKDPAALYLAFGFAIRKANPTQSEAEYAETAAHEDMHSQAENLPGSINRRPYPANDLLNDSAENFEEKILAAEDAPDPTQARRNLIPKLRHWVARGIKLSTEELAAELFAQQHTRKDIPQDTFSAVLTKYYDFFMNFQAKGNWKSHLGRRVFLHEAFGSTLDRFNLTKLREQTNSMYSRLQAHAPDRVRDLDIALVLFWPHMHFVEGLVNKWVTAAN